jgi:methionyl-tRNA formyltransferase
MNFFEKLHLLVDNPDSWMWRYVDDIKETLSMFSNDVSVFRKISEITEGDILFILSCDRILDDSKLASHPSNIVIHGGDLPKEKGWSPWTWQIEQGKDKIGLTLFEAVKELDSGPWYLKETVSFTGYELLDEIRKRIVRTEILMIRHYLENYPLEPKNQIGEETFFERRSVKNQELDIDKTIRSQFNKLRVCDNEHYPAHFYMDGHKYIVKISSTE